MGKQSREAGALAIRNVGVIEQAYQLIENEISNELFFMVEKIIDTYIPKEWWRKMPYLEAKSRHDDPSWFAPKEWRSGEDESEAQFNVWAESPDVINDEWYLTQLCGQGEAKVGFRWKGDHKGLKLSAWKAFASQQHSKHPRLSELGFQYEEAAGSWFIPLLVDVAKLADAYADNAMEIVLEPAIKECLSKVEEAVPIFTAIIGDARKPR